MFEINDKKYKDLCITHLLSTDDWINELKEVGFEGFEIYYDYNKKYKKEAKRIMIIAKKP